MERNDAADVAKHGPADHLADFTIPLIQLTEKLIRDRQTQFVFAGLTQNAGKALGGEVLKLVSVGEERAPSFFRDVGTTHRGQLHTCNQQ